MTREELKEHCEKQVESCEMWAHTRGEKPSGKVYEEHKLILELLEQVEMFDKIRAEIEALEYLNIEDGSDRYDKYIEQYEVLNILDKYKAESEGKE